VTITRLLSACGLAIFLLATPAERSDAAAIIDRASSEIPPRIIIEVNGVLLRDDGKRFEQIAAAYEKAVVVLSGDGGSLLAGIQIGTFIRLRNWPTIVPNDAVCASSCAFAWLGGTTRYMGSSARIGFHAAYVVENGQTSESGAANALLGAYLNRLGLSDSAILYITSSPPQDLQWMSLADARDLGIDVALLPPEPPKTYGSAAPALQRLGPSASGPATPPGQGAEAKFATWDLGWLFARRAADSSLPQGVQPKRVEDIDRLARYAAVVNADVVAFQGVDGQELAARIFPPDRCALHLTADPSVLRTGLAVRKGIPFTAHADLAPVDPIAAIGLRSYAGLASGATGRSADVTVHLSAGDLRVLAVHLVSGGHDLALLANNAACMILRYQLANLQDWIAARAREGIPFVLMGDFNRWMDGEDAFWGALSRTAPLSRATAGHSTPCWGGDQFVDHIVAGGAARTWMQPDTLRVLVFRETGPEWKERLSEHCPVSVGFRLPGGQ
jgi:endonuclease/exonuclease/phosphatase family metal-dependent hydrolase